MNKRKLIKEVAIRTGFSVHISKIVTDCVIENISSALKQGDRVTLRDFGAFYNAEKRGKRYYDIHTGEIKTYPNKKVIKFVPYKKFKEQLLFNVLDTHIVNDGSIGNSIVVGRYIYYNLTHYTDVKRINNTNLKPTLGKENIARRVIRKPELETINLSFEGHFLFDHFLGENEHTEYPSLKVSKKKCSYPCAPS